jgi:hypothetical protein
VTGNPEVILPSGLESQLFGNFTGPAFSVTSSTGRVRHEEVTANPVSRAQAMQAG